MTMLNLIGGRALSLKKPSCSSFTARTLAKAMSHLCRFAGHTKFHYSVAQHSVLVAHLLRPEPVEIRLAGLLHDCHEVLTGFGDVLSPRKRILSRPVSVELARVERMFDRVIGQKFGLYHGWLYDDRVRRADLMALAIERRDLVDPCDPEFASVIWGGVPDPSPEFEIVQSTPERSAESWLRQLQLIWDGDLDS